MKKEKGAQTHELNEQWQRRRITSGQVVNIPSLTAMLSKKTRRSNSVTQFDN